MSFDNPYDYQGSDETAAAGASGLHGILEELRMTRPWVRLMGVLGMIGAGFVLIAAAFSLIGGLVLGANGLSTMVGGVLQAGVGCLYGYPFWKLLKYGSAINQAEQTGSLADVEVALSHQRMFWRFLGILTALVFGLWLLVFCGFILFGFAI